VLHETHGHLVLSEDKKEGPTCRPTLVLLHCTSFVVVVCVQNGIEKSRNTFLFSKILSYSLSLFILSLSL